MKPHALFVPLLFLSIATAQDSAPISLSGNDHPPFCRGKESDAPDCLTPPRTTYSPEPEYPDKERKARHRGVVVLDLVVDPDGMPRDLKVSRPLSADFDKAALTAVKKWRFSPATKDGKPIATEIKVEVSFHLY